MIHRDGYNGPITFECDTCQEELDTGDEDFTQALGLLREERWTIMKIGEDWFHFCSFECQKEGTRRERWV
jgi:hypothetical protein